MEETPYRNSDEVSGESFASQAQLAELRARLAEDDENPDDVVSWDEVRQSIAQKTGTTK